MKIVIEFEDYEVEAIVALPTYPKITIAPIEQPVIKI